MSNLNSWPLDGQVKLTKKIVKDYCDWMASDRPLPASKIYHITSSLGSDNAEESARKVAFQSILAESKRPMVKNAMDTRRIDQEHQVNPRKNLQYYNRSQQFIDGESNKKMAAFAELMPVLNSIQDKYESQPEYFESYAIQLHDQVDRVLQVKNSELNVFRPQLDYLEQLLYARYRLSMDDLRSMDKNALEEAIMAKDESLLKRGQYLATTAPARPKRAEMALQVKDGDTNSSMKENLINAIFGNNNIRREGERNVERTITISIRDSVLDE